MPRLPTIIVTAFLMLGTYVAAGHAGRVPRRAVRPQPGVGRPRVHQTVAGYKETQIHGAGFAALVRPGGRLKMNGRELARWAAGHVRQQPAGLMSHWLRASTANRFGIDMVEGGVTVTARISDRTPAASRPTYRQRYQVRDFRGGRQLHVFEYGADHTVNVSFARNTALGRYRQRHPESAGRLVPARERLIVRPDGTQRLTILFDPKQPAARLPLD